MNKYLTITVFDYVEDSLYDAKVRERKINDTLGVKNKELDKWLIYARPNRRKPNLHYKFYPI
jgi:hypothetical protein